MLISHRGIVSFFGDTYTDIKSHKKDHLSKLPVIVISR